MKSENQFSSPACFQAHKMWNENKRLLRHHFILKVFFRWRTVKVVNLSTGGFCLCLLLNFSIYSQLREHHHCLNRTDLFYFIFIQVKFSESWSEGFYLINSKGFNFGWSSVCWKRHHSAEPSSQKASRRPVLRSWMMKLRGSIVKSIFYFLVSTYIPPMVTVAQVRSEKAGVPSAGPVAARM